MVELRTRHPQTFVTSTFPGELVLFLDVLFLFSFLSYSFCLYAFFLSFFSEFSFFFF